MLTVAEGGHSQKAAEDPLIVSIKETTDTSKRSNAKNANIPNWEVAAGAIATKGSNCQAREDNKG